MAISEERLELNLERAAHRETRAYLARVIQALQYYQARTRDLEQGYPPDGQLPIPTPLPIPIPTPVPAGSGGGGEVMVLVCAVMRSLAHLASQLALQQGGTPPGHEVGGWVHEVQDRVDRLVAALPAGTGGTGTTPTGGHRGYPPTQPGTGAGPHKQGEHQNTPPPP